MVNDFLRFWATQEALYGLLGLYIFLMIVEWLYYRWAEPDQYDGPDALGNLGVNVITIGLKIIFSIVIPFTLYILVYENFRLATIPIAWWSFIVLFLAQDFLWFFEHKLAHRVGLLWAIHHVHHSSEHYNLTTAGRIFVLDGMSRTILLLVLAIAGFQLEQFLMIVILSDTWGIFVHSKAVKPIPWLDRIIVTPSNHRVHHGRNPQYIDKNYGHVLIIWDRLLGSFEPEVEEVQYGITDSIHTNNSVKIYVSGFDWLFSKMKRCTTTVDKIKCLFMPPEWEPQQGMATASITVPSEERMETPVH